VSTVSSTKPEILEIEFLKEILQSLGLGNAGLLLDAKKKRVTIQYETLVRPSDIKGKEEKE
jgi:hypothetical protein